MELELEGSIERSIPAIGALEQIGSKPLVKDSQSSII